MNRTQLAVEVASLGPPVARLRPDVAIEFGAEAIDQDPSRQPCACSGPLLPPLTLLALPTHPHPRFRDRTVAEVFAEEKPRLLSLPDALPETDLVAPASVDTTAFVRFGTNI